MKEIIKFFRYASSTELRLIFGSSDIDTIYDKNTEESIFLKVLNYLGENNNSKSCENIVYTKFDRLKEAFSKAIDDYQKSDKPEIPILKPITYFLNGYSYEFSIKSLTDNTRGINRSITFYVYVRNLPKPDINHPFKVLINTGRFYCGDAIYQYNICGDDFEFVEFNVDNNFTQLMNENYRVYTEPSAPPYTEVNKYIDNFLKEYEKER